MKWPYQTLLETQVIHNLHARHVWPIDVVYFSANLAVDAVVVYDTDGLKSNGAEPAVVIKHCEKKNKKNMFYHVQSKKKTLPHRDPFAVKFCILTGVADKMENASCGPITKHLIQLHNYTNA